MKTSSAEILTKWASLVPSNSKPNACNRQIGKHLRSKNSQRKWRTRKVETMAELTGRKLIFQTELGLSAWKCGEDCTKDKRNPKVSLRICLQYHPLSTIQNQTIDLQFRSSSRQKSKTPTPIMASSIRPLRPKKESWSNKIIPLRKTLLDPCSKIWWQTIKWWAKNRNMSFILRLPWSISRKLQIFKTWWSSA